MALAACTPSSDGFDYGTESDSARYYFLKGWEEILDNGRWTESEMAFRKALEFDPDWALGKSLVGRITRNPEEKERILRELQSDIYETGPVERMLLEVNMLSIGASVNRDKGIPNSAEFNESRRQLAEKNFGAFARDYPEDDYFKAEYIEFLHANHGAGIALDSLRLLATERQKKLGFYISYAASLELELGNVEKAISLSEEYKTTFPDPSYLSAMIIDAQIQQAQNNPEKALELVNQVVAADTNHLIAVGMQARLRRLVGEATD